MTSRFAHRKGGAMILVDGYYLYNVGGSLHPLEKITHDTKWIDAWLPLYVAAGELEIFVNNSVYAVAVRSSRRKANELLTTLKEQAAEAEKPENQEKLMGSLAAYRLSKAVGDFETVLAAEFGLTPLFLVTPKRGYDLYTLINAGQSLFPESLSTKAPEAIEDIRAGAKCLAFELPTAAAFHFHRANEAVLRKYWEAIRPGKPHPGNKTIGDYLSALGKSRKGSPKIKAALRDIKDLYRNPVLHPEYSLKDVDEAVALLNSIHTVVVLMLEKIPAPPSMQLPAPMQRSSASLA